MIDVPTRLVIKRGPNPEEAYSLPEAEVTIGRSSTNVIAIADPEVSRRHASITFDEGSYNIEDWASTNGTFVNGRRISGPIALLNGDEIRLGDTILLQFQSSHENLQPRMINDSQDWADAVTIVESKPQVRQVVTEQEAVPAAPVEFGPPEQFVPPQQRVERGGFGRRVLGCGCGFLLIVFLCMATVYFLDVYQQGRLLYCGPIRPLFEILLGPFGFSPICP